MSQAAVTGATYGVELLYDRPYDLTDPRFVEGLRVACPDAEIRAGDGPIVVFHKDVPIKLADRTICAQTGILGTSAPVHLDELEPALSQSRAWPEARATVSGATHRLLVTDLMSSSLDAALRLDVFQRALAAIVRLTRPLAISWVAAGKLVDPAAFLEVMASPDPVERVVLALNVRLFQVGNRPGECVMDTLGLGALMLPDLQIHFVKLDPNAVAHQLFNSALYLFQKGDVIEDEQTIDGVPAGTKWRCQHEDALVGPKRIVIDLDPGPPYAAGNRSHPAPS